MMMSMTARNLKHWFDKLTRQAYNEAKKLASRLAGLWWDLSALQSHCRALILMAPSKEPARKGIPSPMSPWTRSPSTSRSLAMSVNNRNEWCGPSLWIRRLTQHRNGNVNANPIVALLIKAFSRKTRSTANVEDETGLVVWQGQEFDSTFRHIILNFNHTCTKTQDQGVRHVTLKKKMKILTFECTFSPPHRCKTKK